MASRRSASLARRFPHRADVPLLLTASAVLITLGLTLPAIETHTLVFWRAEYSIAKNIGHLNAEGKVAAASILRSAPCCTRSSNSWRCSISG
jgi:hypothetical protein